MINIGLYYKIKPGHEKEFEKTFLGVVSLLKGSDLGFLGGKLYREIADPSEYMLYTEWTSLESFRKFSESKAYKDTVAFGKTIVEGRPRHKVFRE